MNEDSANLKKEVERLKRENDELKKKVGKDSLTGLISFQSDIGKDSFQAFFDKCSRIFEHNDSPICWIVFVDLYKFKEINDSCGHGVGDIVLECAAKALKSALRSYDLKAFFDMQNAEATCTRAGGDEFVLGLENVKEKNLSTVFNRIVSSYSRIIKKTDIPKEKEICLNLGFNFGAVSMEYLGKGKTLDDWTKMADSFMYKAKEFAHKSDECRSTYVINDSEPKEI